LIIHAQQIREHNADPITSRGGSAAVAAAAADGDDAINIRVFGAIPINGMTMAEAAITFLKY
jgi:hypothetical protein